MLEASGLGEATRGDKDALPPREIPPPTTDCNKDEHGLQLNQRKVKGLGVQISQRRMNTSMKFFDYSKTSGVGQISMFNNIFLHLEFGVLVWYSSTHWRPEL